MDKKIDFFIIGAQKSATTSIYEYLNSIEGRVIMPLVKEMQVFTNDNLYRNFPKNISSFYKKIDQAYLLGMADVEILYAHEKTAERIFSYNQDAKIIIMLRNPIDRAYSSFWFSRNNQREELDSFEAAIADEGRRKENLNQNDKLALTYLDVGMYYKQVKSFIDLFNSNVLVLVMEEFIVNKEEEFNKTLDFLRIHRSHFSVGLLNKKFNEGRGVKSKSLQRLFNKKNILRNIYTNFIPLSFRMKLRKNYINPMLQRNSKDFKSPELSYETRDKLKNYFDNDIKKLSNLLNKDLSKIWFNSQS